MSELLSRKEAAKRLHMSEDLLDQERASGHLAYIQRKPGGKVYITDTAIEEYLARATHPARVATRGTMETYRRRRVL